MSQSFVDSNISIWKAVCPIQALILLGLRKRVLNSPTKSIEATPRYSAFQEADRRTPSGLSGYLRDRGLTRVVLIGLAIDFCVAWSAHDAHDGEFGAVVLEDACRDINRSSSLDAAWEVMTAAAVERATSANMPD